MSLVSCLSTPYFPEYHFKPFRETYKVTAGCLSLGLMYPDPSSEKLRVKLIMCLLVVSCPIVYMVLFDMYLRLCNRDIFQALRHSTIAGPFLGALLKKLMAFYNRSPTKELLDEINRDYEKYNHLPRRCQVLAADSIRYTRYFYEKIWVLAIGVVIMIFLGLAVISTLYSYFFDEVPTRYMIHEVDIPFLTHDQRLDSPYYEVMFVYMAFCAIVMSINYAAYDGLFGVLTDHSVLKMNIYCMLLEDAFKLTDPEEIERGVQIFLEEQYRCFKFNRLIQDVHQVWLGIIYMATMIQVGSLLYNVSAGNGIDLRYAVFSASCIIHTFLPCRNAANMKQVSIDTSTVIYSSGWEHINSMRVRRIIPFLIARAQQPEQLEAFKLFTYDMELFVTIMRTSYTMFTLLESN